MTARDWQLAWIRLMFEHSQPKWLSGIKCYDFLTVIKFTTPTIKKKVQQPKTRGYGWAWEIIFFFWPNIQCHVLHATIICSNNHSHKVYLRTSETPRSVCATTSEGSISNVSTEIFTSSKSVNNMKKLYNGVMHTILYYHTAGNFHDVQFSDVWFHGLYNIFL